MCMSIFTECTLSYMYNDVAIKHVSPGYALDLLILSSSESEFESELEISTNELFTADNFLCERLYFVTGSESCFLLEHCSRSQLSILECSRFSGEVPKDAGTISEEA